MKVKLTFYPTGSMKNGWIVGREHWVAETWIKWFGRGHYSRDGDTREEAVTALRHVVHFVRMREHEAKSKKPRVTWLEL